MARRFVHLPIRSTRLWMLGLLGTLLLVGAACTAAGPSPEAGPTTGGPAATAPATPAPTSTSPRDNGAPERVPREAQEAVVERIVDGDTLELAAVAAGTALADTQQVDVRLLEIDAPETKHPDEPVQCYGAEATRHLRQLAPPGSTVWVQRDAELRDQYGRYLLYLWNADGGFVNLAMVADGYAKAKLYMPNDKHWSRISSADVQARSTGNGQWGACPYFGAPKDTPEPTPEPQVPEPEPQPEADVDSYLFPPPPPDKDCDDVSAQGFRVRPGDPHRFDADGDGIGCEG